MDLDSVLILSNSVVIANTYYQQTTSHLVLHIVDANIMH